MEEKLQEIINILKDNQTSNIISILSLGVAIVAVIITIVSNIKNNRRYINSLKPILIFKLYEKNGFLILYVKNNGQSEAKNIKINFLSLNNDEVGIDDIFKAEIMLYPSEEIQGIIMQNNQEKSPTIRINVKYIQGNDNKLVSYKRSIAYKKEIQIKDGIDNIAEEIRSIAYSNNRMANYIEGRTLFKFDELNVMPRSSLYKDLRNAINNRKCEENDEYE